MEIKQPMFLQCRACTERTNILEFRRSKRQAPAINHIMNEKVSFKLKLSKFVVP